jgi:hypothetical protein
MNYPSSYLAIVAIGKDHSLMDTAKILNSIFDGFTLIEDVTGRFEEVPAFVDRKSSIDIQLFGVPINEVSDHYVLEVCSAEKIHPSISGIEIGSSFVGNFPINIAPLKNGYVDISKYVINFISSRSILKCWPINGVRLD